jgi:hypothetical protein
MVNEDFYFPLYLPLWLRSSLEDASVTLSEDPSIATPSPSIRLSQAQSAPSDLLSVSFYCLGYT